MASEIIIEEINIIVASGKKLVSLGSLAAQRVLSGKEPKDHDDQAKSIIKLLTAYRQRANLSNDDLESILYNLKELS